RDDAKNLVGLTIQIDEAVLAHDGVDLPVRLSKGHVIARIAGQDPKGKNVSATLAKGRPVIRDERRPGFGFEDREHQATELALRSRAADALERPDRRAAVHRQ